MQDEPLRILYQTLKNDNYDVPDNYDAFANKLRSDKQARHILYKTLRDDNYDVPDQYDRYEHVLFPEDFYNEEDPSNVSKAPSERTKATMSDSELKKREEFTKQQVNQLRTGGQAVPMQPRDHNYYKSRPEVQLPFTNPTQTTGAKPSNYQTGSSQPTYTPGTSTQQKTQAPAPKPKPKPKPQQQPLSPKLQPRQNNLATDLLTAKMEETPMAKELQQQQNTRVPFASEEATRDYERQQFLENTGEQLEQLQQSQEGLSQRLDETRENTQKAVSLNGSHERQYNPETGKVEDVYYTMAGNKVNTPLEQMRENRRTDNEEVFEERLYNFVSENDPDNTAEMVWNEAEAKTAAANAKAASRAFDGFAQPSIMGGNTGFAQTGQYLASSMVNHMTYHDLKKLADETWNKLGKEKREAIINDVYYALLERYPHADEAELKSAAETYARQQSDKRVFDIAVEKNVPKNATDLFFRRMAESNAIFKLAQAAARKTTGTTGDWEARELAEQNYAKEGHKTAEVLGSVAGITLDPMMMLSGGVAGAATRGGLWLGGRFVGDAAARRFGATLGGRMLQGAVGGAANFATFEAGNEALEQLRWGGARNEKTGEVEDYDVKKILKSGGHGVLMGAATGVMSPYIGNVSEKIVRNAESTGEKIGVRAAQLGVSTVAEGTIFSIPDWIKGDQPAMDVWTDNMVMMLGFKGQHLLKSAPRVIRELSRNPQSKAGFETRLRNSLDKEQGALALTKDERNELQKNGYTDLKELVEEYENYNKDKTGERKETDEGEELPYNRFVELMNDGRISEAARAKMYYYITGNQLPMSTVMGSGVVEEKNENGDVTGYTVQSYGANGVITSRYFGNAKAAKSEVERINRQAELNGIDIGERWTEYKGDMRRMWEACDFAAEKLGTSTRTLYDLMKRSPDEMNDIERGWAEQVNAVYEADGDKYSTKALREEINKKYKVDLDKAIAKEPDRRTDVENKALKEYVDELYIDIENEAANEPLKLTGRTGEYNPAEDEVRRRYNTEDPTAVESFENGYEEVVEPEDRQDVYTWFKQKGDELRAMVGDETMQRIDEDPFVAKAEIDQDATVSDDVKLAVAEYVAGKAYIDGVEQRIIDDADNIAAQQREALKSIQHPDGNIRKATMTVEGEEQPVEVYVTDGNIVMTPDGSTVEKEQSDKTVVVYNPLTGEKKQVDPSTLAYDQVQSVDDALADIETKRKTNIQRQLDEAQGKVTVGMTLPMMDGTDASVVSVNDDGTVTLQRVDGTQENMAYDDAQRLMDAKILDEYNERHEDDEQQEEQPTTQQPTTQHQQQTQPEQPKTPKMETVEGKPKDYEAGMTLTIKDEDGTTRDVVVTGKRAKWTPEGPVEDPDGRLVELYDPQNVDDSGNATPIYKHNLELDEMVQSYSVPSEATEETQQEVPTEQAPATETEQPTETTENAPVTEQETPTEATAEEPHKATEETTDPMQQPMPMKKVGKKTMVDYRAATEERTYKYLYEDSVDEDFGADDADRIVKDKIAKAEKALSETKKLTGDVEEIKAKRKAARMDVDYWKKVQSLRNQAIFEEQQRRAAEDTAAAEQRRQRAEEAEQARLAEQKRYQAEQERLKAEREKAQSVGLSMIEESGQQVVDDGGWKIEDDADAMAIMNDTEPKTLEEVAANMLASGKYRLLPEETRKQTGYGKADYKNLHFIFAGKDKGGLTPGNFGDLVLTRASEQNVKFDETDANAGLNALLNVLGGVESNNDINNYIRNNRKAEAEQLHNINVVRAMQAQEEDRWIKQHGGMTMGEYANYIAYMEDAVEQGKTAITDEEFNNLFEPAYDTRTTTNDEGSESGSAEKSGTNEPETRQAATAADDTRGDGEEAAEEGSEPAVASEKPTAEQQYKRHYTEAEAEIADIEKQLDNRPSKKNDRLIQQIADKEAEAEERLEDNSLSDEERTRLQAQYDAASKWMDDNVRSQKGMPAAPTAEQKTLTKALVGWLNGIGIKTHAAVRKGQEMLNKYREKARKQKDGNVPVFYSNAMKAVEGIKQEKATAEQWLAMLQKNGGLKAGEDKWIGLSEWLNDHKGESLTKQQVMDHIKENAIEIEDVEYKEGVDIDNNPQMQKFREEFDAIKQQNKGERSDLEVELDKFEDEMYDKYGSGWYNKLNDEEIERAEKFDSLSSTEGTSDEKAFREMVERYGDDFSMAFEVDGNGVLVPVNDQYNDSGVTKEAEYFLELDKRPINSTRLEYTTDGLDNKREIALVVPNIESWNKYDDVHFGDAGEGRAVAWVRFGETTDKDGNRVLVIDEIQSKRHQEGREKGYIDTTTLKRFKELEEKRDGLKKELKDVIHDIPSDYTLTSKRDSIEEQLKEIRNKIHELKEGGIIPDAPFEKNWHEVAMKRMLRYAAENGFDKVAWTTGEQQAERYDIGSVIDSIKVRSTADDGSRTIWIRSNKDNYTYKMDVDKDGVLHADKAEGIYSIDGKNISEVFGKSLGEKIMNTEKETEFSGDDLRIGGEGMKGFYDQILPRYMDKYGKKWGVKTGEVELPNIGDNGLTMHSVDVTPEMKASVLEGQPMFFRDKDGEVIGYTVNGEIYIDPRYAKPETPVHEYAHLIVHAIRANNPQVWEKWKSLAQKETDVIAKVRELYPELSENDDDFWEEVITTYTGAKGGKLLEAQMREEMAKADGAVEKAKVANIFHRLRDLLKRFWDMTKDIFSGSAKGIENFKSMDDVVDLTLAALANKFDPRASQRAATEARDKEYMEAVEKGDVEAEQKMVDEAAKQAGYTIHAYHGSPNEFTQFSLKYLGASGTTLEGKGFYFTDKKDVAGWFAKRKGGEGKIYDVYLKIDKPLSNDKKTITKKQLTNFLIELGEQENEDEINYLSNYGDTDRRGIETVAKEAANLEYNSNDNDVDLIHSVINVAGDVETVFNVLRNTLGYDGIIVTNPTWASYQTIYLTFHPDQIKSADPVTYDDNGNVIPLSKRFNKRNADIRYQKAEKVNDIYNTGRDVEYVNDEGEKRTMRIHTPASEIEKIKPTKIEPHDLSREEQKELYKSFKPETNKNTGEKVIFYNSAFEKNHRDGGLFEKIVPQIRDLFKDSVLGFSEPENLAGTVRPDGTVHKEHRDIIGFGNYLNKVKINGKDYYVRFTVQRKKGESGLHSSFVSNVELYENPIEVAYGLSHGEGRLDFDRISDAKLRHYFETAKNNSQVSESQNTKDNEMLSRGVTDEERIAELEHPSEDADWQSQVWYTMPERWFDIQRGTMSYEDGVRMSKLRGYSKKRYDDMLKKAVDGFKKHIMDLAEKMHIADRVQVVETADEITDARLTEKQKRDKALYDPTTGKIYIILGNNRDIDDAVKSLLHEAVGHHGLRELFGEHFDTFLDNVFAGSTESIRREIASLASKHGWNIRTATEEYLSMMAETMDFERPDRASWWGRVKMWFYDMLHKIGFKVNEWTNAITDNELSYLLWRSYQNLVNPGRYRSPIENAKDVVMQDKMKVGRYEEGPKDNTSNREALRAAEGVAEGIIDDVKLDNDAYVGMWTRMEGEDMSIEQAQAIKKAIEKKILNGLTQEELADHYDMLDAVNEYIAEKKNDEDNNGILSRDGDFTDRDVAIAKDAYEKSVAKSGYQIQEALQDSMLGLRKLYEAVLGKKNLHIEDVKDYENAYLAENLMSSVNRAEQDNYFSQYMRPLLSAIGEICGNDKEERQKLVDYMMAKHGLERNEKFAQRDFNAYQQKHPFGQKKLDDFRSRDYAGLTALTGKDNVVDAEAEAQKMVNDFESQHKVTNLWKQVNNATKTTLAKVYLSGMMSKDSYNQVRDMFDYYIPLRGWDETTSDEVYGYLTSKDGPIRGGSIMKHAEGRSSKADDPIATIAMMAEDAIRQGNRNVMKQRFLAFVMNHPSDLVSVNKLWLRYDDVNDEWVPVFADIKDGDTAADVERKVKAFEQRMEQLAQQDPDNYKRGRQAANIPYKVVNNNLNEHQILVRQNGETYVLTVNGNPRAAQALNGLTNPDVEAKNAIVNAVLNGVQNFNKFMSSAYTTKNPDFVLSNWLRDTVYTTTMIWAKESPKYAGRFYKNLADVNPATMLVLFEKWHAGKLDNNKKLEKQFKLFMLNGGETGYTAIKDIEHYKKDIKKELRRNRNKAVAGLNIAGIQLDLLNRAVENSARFAAFLTSKEMGRSDMRSAYDAKEISVNFNKKGSGDKFSRAEGQTLLGKAASYVSGGGRLLYVFWNASLQGMTNVARATKRHPVKALTLAATMFALGRLAPILAQLMGGDDDDDKNAYYNLPEYVRRSNFCVRAGDVWITIPLPIEYRVMYGMGELYTGITSGNEHYTDKEMRKQIVSQLSQAMPIDFMEGGGGLHAFVPSVAKPFVEASNNKSWTGLPLYRDTPYNQDDPDYTKVYSNADKYIVGASKWLNEMSGGDEYKKGLIDINPAKVEYILKGYLGGWFNLPNQLVKMGETATGNRDFEWRNMMLANRVVKEGDERTERRKLTNEYFNYLDEYKETDRLIKNYTKAAESGSESDKYSKKLQDLYNSDEYGTYLVMERYKPIFDAYHDLEKDASDEERKVIADEVNELRKECIGIIRSVKNDKYYYYEPQTEETMQRLYEDGRQEIRDKIGSMYAKQQGTKDSYGGGNAYRTDYGVIYERNRDYLDMAGDIALQVAIKDAKEDGDEERRKALEKVRKDITELKKQLPEYESDPEYIMNEIRSVRNQAFEDYGITTKKKEE